MNVVIKENQFNISNVYYTEPIQNIVMDNSKFIKIIYSTENIMTSGLCLLLQLKIANKEFYFKKLKFVYDINTNKEILSKIYDIESIILHKFGNQKKQRKILYESLSSGTIKLFPNNENELNNNNNNNSFILKISGIWENDTEYGLTYKILYI
jgi:hypothetical protein